MTPSAIDMVLAAANPLSDRQATALPVHGAEIELIEEITAIPISPHPRHQAVVRRGRRRAALGVAVTAAVAAVAAAVVLLGPGDRGGGPAPAFAAPLVRFAHASPLALLELPGWHVVYADEEVGGWGEMNFVRGPANPDGALGVPRGASFKHEASLVGRVASLTWQPLNPSSRRQVTAGHQTAPTGLGVAAHRFVREGSGHGWLDISALLVDHGRLLTYRATVTNMAMFRAQLRALTAVGTTTWLRAMPPSVVKSADSGPTVRLMLKGIPLPPGFDAARIRGAHLVHDRYQLGAAVTGTVACMWIAEWSHARATGDTAMVTRAIDAMATAPRWPILHWMAKQGAWPQVLIGYAKAMPKGRWYGRSLTANVNSGLGCRQWGVDLLR
jgi:hypothetical protein